MRGPGPAVRSVSWQKRGPKQVTIPRLQNQFTHFQRLTAAANSNIPPPNGTLPASGRTQLRTLCGAISAVRAQHCCAPACPDVSLPPRRTASPPIPKMKQAAPKRRPSRFLSNFNFPISAPLSLDANAATTNTLPASGDSASDIPDTRNASPPDTAGRHDPHDHPNCDSPYDASHTPAHPPTAPPQVAALSEPAIPSKAAPPQSVSHTSQAYVPVFGVTCSLRLGRFHSQPG